jgi:hypothetical protein
MAELDVPLNKPDKKVFVIGVGCIDTEVVDHVYD